MKGRAMHIPIYTLAKWAGAALTVLTLGGWMSSASVRLHKMEAETGKVAGIEHQVKVITLYLKLQDPTLYKKAEELAQ